MSEGDLSKLIQLEALKHKCKLFRNNAGSMTDKTGRVVRYGLANVSKKLWDNWKTSDLIGYTLVTIEPDMVGKTFAVFAAVEVKLPDAKVDDRYRAQEKFILQVQRDGGIAAICNSVESLEKMFKDFFTQD